MKAKQREIYEILCGEIDAELCLFCKFAVWEGECGETYPTCTHPLAAVYRHYEEHAPILLGCWGFRPRAPVSDVADVVGLVLANQWYNWSVGFWPDGIIIVRGRTREKVGDMAERLCPRCKGELEYDEVDLSVSTIHGNSRCPCGWSEEEAIKKLFTEGDVAGLEERHA